MKNIKIIILLLSFLAFLSQAHALDVPRLLDRVNDYADMFAREEKANLIKKLEAYEKETSNQIVVLTIPSLEGDVLEDFSKRVVDGWKIGQSGKNNGGRHYHRLECE